jgi:hypothetical protein
VDGKEWGFLNDYREQLQNIDGQLKRRLFKYVALQSDAEKLIARKDFIFAEKMLRTLYGSPKHREWAYAPLIQSLYEQRKAKAIWDIYSDPDKPDIRLTDEGYINAISYASMALGKRPYEGQSYSLKNITFTGLKNADSKFENIEFENVTYLGSVLQGSIFKNNQISGLRVSSSNLRDVNFEGMVGDNISDLPPIFRPSVSRVLQVL